MHAAYCYNRKIHSVIKGMNTNFRINKKDINQSVTRASLEKFTPHLTGAALYNVHTKEGSQVKNRQDRLATMYIANPTCYSKERPIIATR